MFAFARFIIRHKVGATAVVALGVFFMTPGEEAEVSRSDNPWALEPSQMAASTEPGMIDGVLDSTVAYLDESGMNPIAASDETVGRLEDTATAMGAANASN